MWGATRDELDAWARVEGDRCGLPGPERGKVTHPLFRRLLREVER